MSSRLFVAVPRSSFEKNNKNYLEKLKTKRQVEITRNFAQTDSSYD